MTLLQIHIGELSPQRQACFASAVAMYPEASVVRVDKGNVAYFVNGMKSFYEIEKTPDEWNWNKLKSIVWLSDNLRFWLLSQFSDTLYADSDVLHLKRFEFDKESKAPYLMGVPADTAMMYSATACDYFLDKCLRCKADKWRGNPMVYMSGGDGIPITRDYYEHYGAGEWKHKATDRHWWMN